ncbi:MAG: PLP-dependent transferase [Hoeflea sp.]|uniref:trans-sulfuration enzyme family protein n=1 Tax=Hoeflea sp. TaxID=1940281 RepID=UPI001DF0C4F3|nr:PLP-dependent transferase [Hoeflea sp.]MBU4530602.1 PLP-dependent transferase [Alphaproteobacteria bacterium]MBU4545381.1 PLP-dependent transferase [Alphaproteobacteria bacterium]MBU4552275.1 PLP-dependent transferase [Alphaproteobacteria bacterium]MBV1721836.1 PLP-dependent transferase [Hoeflea sp.]MBV1761524.1 PLP-dependent transferase [Hoeflea sp.]
MKAETELLKNWGDDLPFRALTVPPHRGSTVLFDTVAEFFDRHRQFYDGYSYGLYSHPAARALEKAMAALEGGARAVLAPSGMAAITLVNLTVLSSGDEVLIPKSAYGPSRQAALHLLGQLGIAARDYAPDADISNLLSPRTRLVWVEAPGSFGMEMQDVPAIVAAAHRAGAAVASDGTWASPLGFRALSHGVDFAVQALSKYISGHSDVLMGSVAVADEARFRALKDRSRTLGYGVSPDDCALTLRGLGTLAVRLDRQAATALALAEWLSTQTGVTRVLHPALPGDPGHALWARDFTGAGAVFSMLLDPGYAANLPAFLENCDIFRIGASWGGLHSLLAPADMSVLRDTHQWADAGRLVRIGVGLEALEDLQRDLERGLGRYRGAARDAAE